MATEQVSIIIRARDLASSVLGKIRNNFGSIIIVANQAAALFGKLVRVAGQVSSGFADLLRRGRDLTVVQSAFNRAAGTGTSALRALRESTQGLVRDYDLMVGFNRAVTLGAVQTTQEFGDLTQTAIALGRAMGLDASVAIDKMTLGLARLSPKLLDDVGLTVSAGEANVRYAAALGVAVSALTDAQRREAFRAAAIDASRVALAKLGKTALGAGDTMQTLRVQVENAVDSIGKKINESDFFAGILSRATSFVEDLADIFMADSGTIREVFDALGTLAGHAFMAALIAPLPFVSAETEIAGMEASVKRIQSLASGARAERRADEIRQTPAFLEARLGVLRAQRAALMARPVTSPEGEGNPLLRLRSERDLMATMREVVAVTDDIVRLDHEISETMTALVEARKRLRQTSAVTVRRPTAAEAAAFAASARERDVVDIPTPLPLRPFVPREVEQSVQVFEEAGAAISDMALTVGREFAFMAASVLRGTDDVVQSVLNMISRIAGQSGGTVGSIVSILADVASLVVGRGDPAPTHVRIDSYADRALDQMRQAQGEVTISLQGFSPDDTAAVERLAARLDALRGRRINLRLT